MTALAVSPAERAEAVRKVRKAVDKAIAARDAGMARAEASEITGWNRALIDQAIDAFAGGGITFSANDLRELLPQDLPSGLYGARFAHAANNRGVIRFVGYTPSTKKNTHAKNVALWVGVANHS